MSPRINHSILAKYLAYLFATGFGTGYIPLAPGTAGSLLALVLFWIFPFGNITWLIICLLFLIIGLWAGSVVEKEEGKDPGIIVIDEMVGQWCALLFLPLNIPLLIASFFLFRAFDIIKPFPARKSEDLKGGAGIMIDDIIAGIYANIILQIIVYFWT
jgi:phosphatidylglycerophosphatase A